MLRNGNEEDALMCARICSVDEEGGRFQLLGMSHTRNTLCKVGRDNEFPELIRIGTIPGSDTVDRGKSCVTRAHQEIGDS